MLLRKSRKERGIFISFAVARVGYIVNLREFMTHLSLLIFTRFVSAARLKAENLLSDANVLRPLIKNGF